MPIYQSAHYQVRLDAVDRVKARSRSLFVTSPRMSRGAGSTPPGRKSRTQPSSSTCSSSKTKQPTRLMDVPPPLRNSKMSINPN